MKWQRFQRVKNAIQNIKSNILLEFPALIILTCCVALMHALYILDETEAYFKLVTFNHNAEKAYSSPKTERLGGQDLYIVAEASSSLRVNKLELKENVSENFNSP
jgi:hypothetical protein